ncbi:Bor/Iss family lipoprotein [Pinibacter soli]|uniref:Uncharacterized protein n=1 Tax=Pinibacter soli TaxID=3044211 RepID=A0ABT6RA86_9BACT|nr:hypothetical protein [Pinibacter soli]MDI3319473.1 hypothetical protein [Pinibacter soli]
MRLQSMIAATSLVCCCSFSSCYSYRLATHAQSSTDDIYPNHKKVHSMFWGLLNSPQVIQTPVCDSLHVLGVSEVRIKVGFGNALLTVFTLGIYCPATVYWKCSKPCPITDSL